MNDYPNANELSDSYGELEDNYEKMRTHIAELEAKLAAAEADAERYRWLRDRGDDCQWQNLLRVEVDEFSSLDAAIDAARGGE